MSHGISNVPFVDLGVQRDLIAEEVAKGFERVLASNAYVLGPQVTKFEREYASYCGISHCVGVANGTDALELALRACKIGRDDEVILPANTFVATAEAVERCGAKVVLVDCDMRFLIDCNAVEQAVSPRTRAVIAVHLYGQLADVDGLRRVIGPDVLLIEDAAQSQGARCHHGVSGALGDIAATSFYPGKNLGAYGDAGAVTTSSAPIGELLRKLSNHGGTTRYRHEVVGMNSRLDSLQAVVLSAKLRHLDEWNGQRRIAAAAYDTLLGGSDELAPPTGIGQESHVWHLYVVRLAMRDRVQEQLLADGISTGIHYSLPVHLQPAFAHLGYRIGDFPIAERAASEILSLPMYPGITTAQQERVADAICRAVRRIH